MPIKITCCVSYHQTTHILEHVLNLHMPAGTVADHPEVARQWHPVKNGAFTPQLFGSGSAYRMWWQCPGCACGAKHEWRARCVSYHPKRGNLPCLQ